MADLAVAEWAPPSDPAELQAWLDTQMAELGEMMNAEMERIALDAVTAYLDTVTAAADPAALDGMEHQWRAFVEADVEPYLGKLHLEGSLTAVVTSGTKAPDEFLKRLWAPVVNDEAVQYAKKASNRIVGAGNDVWWKVRSKVTNAVREGVDRETLKGQIEAVTGYTEFRADTIARTEVMGAFNAGDHFGASALGDYGPVEKQWLAALDARTRESHADANEQVVPFNDPFIVGGVAMPFPGQGPPEEVINCRCVVLHLYPGDKRPDGSVIGEVEPPAPPAELTPEQIAADRLTTLKDNVKTLSAELNRVDSRYSTTLKTATESEAKLRQIGKAVDDEVRTRLGDAWVDPEDIANVRRETQSAASSRFREVMTREAVDAGYDPADWLDYMGSRYGSSFDEARVHLRRVDAEYDRLMAKADAAWTIDPVKARQMYHDELLRTLDDVRGMYKGVDASGTSPASWAVDPRSASYGRQVYDNAMRRMPNEWVEASNRRGTINIGDHSPGDNRGWHRWLTGDSEIHIPPSRSTDAGLHVHEMTHRMEQIVDGMTSHEWAFVKRRAKESGEKAPEWLGKLTGNKAYGKGELAFGDKFAEPYMGKVYADAPNASWEVMTMGMERLERGQALDADYLHFVLGALAGL